MNKGKAQGHYSGLRSYIYIAETGVGTNQHGEYDRKLVDTLAV